MISWRILLVRAFAIALFLFFIPFLLVGQTTELHLFVTGDQHGFLFSEASVQHGSTIALGQTLRDLTALLPDSSYLIFDTGDALAYHYLSKVDSGRTIYKAMQRFSFSAMVPGNLDFSYGRQHVQHLQQEFRNPMCLAANLVDSLNHPIFTPWQIFRRSSLRIAVVGLCDPDMRETVANGNLDGIYILDPSTAMSSLLQELNGRFDFLIVLSNLGSDRNARLAKSCPAIDLIVDHPQENVPIELTKIRFEEGQHAVSIVPAPANALSIGHIVLQISRNADGTLSGSLRVSREKIKREEKEELWKLEGQRLQREYDRQCMARYGRSADSPLTVCNGKGSADGFIKFTLYTLLKSTHSEIALLNKGYFRQLEGLSGPVTIRDIDRIEWSDDHVLIMRLRGKALKQLAGHSMRLPAQSNRRLYYMAIQNYDLSAPNSAIWNVHGKPLLDDEEYAVATSHFLGNGGDGYAEFSQKRYNKSRFTGYLRLLSDNRGKQVSINDLIIRSLCANPIANLAEWNDQLASDSFINQPLWQLYVAGIDLAMQSVKVSNTEDYAASSEARINRQAKQSRDYAMNLDTRLVRSSREFLWNTSLWLKYNSTTIWPGNSGRLTTKESNLELAQTLDMRRTSRVSPYMGLRFDSDMELLQRDLIPSLGVKWGRDLNMLRLAGIGKWDGRSYRKSGGLEMNGLYSVHPWTVQMDGKIRLRYLFGNSTATVLEERWSLEWRHGFKIPLSEHLALKPQFEWFLFKGRQLSSMARNWQVSFQLSYSRIWKFQYQKFYRREER
jgi:2',3'-cyclic-nucleotide 2'-phosphodiesterase (5'-nucleotidase family)